MNPNFLSLRKLILAAFMAACTVALFGSAQAAMPSDVGQGMPESDSQGPTDGWLHSNIAPRDSDRPPIRDSQIPQEYTGTPPRTASTDERVTAPASSHIGDEIAVGAALVFAALMGAALTVTVQRFTHRAA